MNITRFSRRDFLKSTGSIALFAGACILSPLSRGWAADHAAGREMWLLCDTPIKPMNGTPGVLAPTNPGSMMAYDPLSNQSFKIDLPFFGHAVTQNPVRTSHAVTFEKWGLRGALVDLRDRTVLANIESGEDFMFFGHAAFINGASALVTSEDGREGHIEGRLVVRDPLTLKPIQKMQSYGNSPHECKALDGGRTLIVVNQGNKSMHSNISWIEVASGKLMHQVILDSVIPHPIFSHLDITADGWICIAGPQPSDSQGISHVAIVSPKGRFMRPKFPEGFETKKMKGEALSVAFLGKSGLFAATLPQGNIVAVFDYKTQKMVASIDLIEPRGIIPDLTAPSQKGLIVNRGQHQNLVRIAFEPSGYTPVVSEASAQFSANGSHMIRMYV